MFGRILLLTIAAGATLGWLLPDGRRDSDAPVAQQDAPVGQHDAPVARRRACRVIVTRRSGSTDASARRRLWRARGGDRAEE